MSRVLEQLTALSRGNSTSGLEVIGQPERAPVTNAAPARRPAARRQPMNPKAARRNRGRGRAAGIVAFHC